MLEAVVEKILVNSAKAAVEKTVESGMSAVQKSFSQVKDVMNGGADVRSSSFQKLVANVPRFAKEQLASVGEMSQLVDSNEKIPHFDINELSKMGDHVESGGEVDANQQIPRFEDLLNLNGDRVDSPSDTNNLADADSEESSDETQGKSLYEKTDSSAETEESASAEVEEDSGMDDSRLDDNGNVYKNEEGDLLPNSQYEVNGTKYTTDDKGRIISAEGYLKDTPDNERDNGAQSDAGGKDRKPGDDGGHLRARMNGGSSGNENLVAMRGTINKGDYKRSENEENRMLKDGKQVYEKIEVTYDDDSSRPSKIEKTYTDGEKTVKVTVDNIEGSTDLTETLKGDISDQDLDNLRNEIEDMKADGNDVSVTSVRREYDSEGELKSVTVCVTNETSGEKEYVTYSPNNG